MGIAIALLSGVAVAGCLLWAVSLLSRRLQLLRQLRFPLSIAALAAGLKVLTLFEAGSLPALDKALSWTLVFLITISLLRILGIYVFDVFLHARGIRLPPLLPRVAMGVAYAVTVLVILPQAVQGLSLTPILASGAITSLVLGLALQPILGNFFSGIVISLEKPFRINDWIEVEGTEGRVVDITWRTTHLRTRDNDTLVIPNSKIADERITNFFYPHPLHLERLYVGVHYRTPPYRVEQALVEVAKAVEGVLEKPSPSVYVHAFEDSAITYELRVWIEDIARKPRIKSMLRSGIWEEFRRRGITIPFPIRTLEVEPRANLLSLAPRRAQDSSPPRRPARLFVAGGADGGRMVLLAEAVAVGRSSRCGLVLTDPKVSKEHLSIKQHEDTYRLTDSGSQFGTKVNGRRVEEAVLRDLDRIEIGDSILVFENQAE